MTRERERERDRERERESERERETERHHATRFQHECSRETYVILVCTMGGMYGGNSGHGSDETYGSYSNVMECCRACEVTGHLVFGSRVLLLSLAHT